MIPSWRGQLLGAALVMFLCLGAAAQDASAGAPSFGWFGGYQNTIVSNLYVARGHVSSSGWAASIFWDPGPGLGLEAEASGFYNSNYCGCSALGDNLPVPPLSAAQYALLAGPRLRMRQSRSGVQPYLHFLFGEGDDTFQGGSVTGFSMELGGGVDFPIRGSRRLAIRVSPDYVMARANIQDTYPSVMMPRNTFRIVVGLVVRFGGK